MTFAKITIASLLGATLLSGCSSQYIVPVEELNPGAIYESSEVSTYTGDYRFERVQVAPDSLVGEYTLEVQRQSSEYGVYYEDEVRTRKIPLGEVVSITTKKRDPERTLFFGAGAFAIAVLARDVFDTTVGTGGGGSSRTKPDPNR